MDNTINDIRKANDIVDVISSYIPLTKKGKNYFGICPFHDDTNPSMSVTRDKQIYKCFSCGASGNVFNFIMDYENVDFKEAARILAKRAGIDFKAGHIKNNNQYEKYYQMYDLALKLYQNNINSAYGKSAVEYLEKRFISKEIIKEFKIGLALDKNALTSILTKKGYSTLEMDKYGLGNGYNDLYFNRIMFPLFDTNNRVVGFSGRIYLSSDKEQSKYINTKETPIFKKGELLYNYYNAKEHCRLKKNVILVEGFMDVIRLYTIGIKNVVALMGTALTKNQINLLKRLSTEIYLCLDGDDAGRKAMASVGEDLINANCNVRVISLTEKLDPDEYILKYGKESFESLYDNAVNFSEFKLSYIKTGFNLSNIEDKNEYIKTVLKDISKDHDDIKKELILKKISNEFDIDISILKNNLKKDEKYSKIETLKKEPEKRQKHDKYTKATYGILYAMMSSYDYAKAYEKRLNYLPSKQARLLANEIIYAYRYNSSLVLADFLTNFSTNEELFYLAREIMKNIDGDEPDEQLFNDYVAVIREYNENQEIKRLKEMIKEEIDPVKKAQLLEKIRLVKMESEKSD